MLTILLILLPLLAGAVVWLLKGFSSKYIALFCSILILAIGLFIVYKFVPNAESQFSATFPWISSSNINFAVGIDGISVIMILLTTLLVPIIILSTFDKPINNGPLFMALF
jgi:NADH-quinone oxidoreductase subunit M